MVLPFKAAEECCLVKHLICKILLDKIVNFLEVKEINI